MNIAYILTFLVLGALCLVWGWQQHSLPWRVVMSLAGLAYLLVSAAYAGLGARLFMKRPDGRISLLGWLIFWPYLLVTRLSFVLARSWRRPAYSEVVGGLYIGRMLTNREAAAVCSAGVSAVLDVVCEMPAPPAFRTCRAYLCLPALDSTAPTLAQLDQAATWIAQQIEHGRVYVHCAAGRGRSAVVVLAYLVRSGRAADIDGAMQILRKVRNVHLNRMQLARLAQFIDGRATPGA